MAEPGSEWAIDLSDVAKTYKGRVHALQGIEMRVRRGEVFGLLGPNGAGKSTLVKIMMTVIRPTHAVGTLLGQPVGHKPTLRHVGYLPENHRFPKYLTGRQTLQFFGALSKVDSKTLKPRVSELLDTVGMSAWADKKISTYSKGMMQRIGLAQAMVNQPDLIVLDEPTDGVDPVGRRDIRDVLLRLKDRGSTVFINSHLLSELEMICDRVAILVRGRVARHGTIDELTREQQRYDIEIAATDPAALRPKLLEILRNLGAVMTESRPPTTAPPGGIVAVPNGLPPAWPAGVQQAGWGTGVRLAKDAGTLRSGEWIELEGPWIHTGTIDPAVIQPLLDALRAAGLIIRRVMPVRQSLEDLFMQAVIDPESGRAYAPGAGRPGTPAPARHATVQGGVR